MVQGGPPAPTSPCSAWTHVTCVCLMVCCFYRVDSPPTILISLDGFRAEYMLRNLTPSLQYLADCGVHAKYMRSAYPSKTFPNHYSIITVGYCALCT